MGKNLEGTSKVQEIHVVMHGDKHLDGLVGLLSDCTHFAGLVRCVERNEKESGGMLVVGVSFWGEFARLWVRFLVFRVCAGDR